VTKHPSDWSKNGDVGHAWIYLQGIKEGQIVWLEGGHSGERGDVQAKYFDGVMNYLDYGVANPSLEELSIHRQEPNPIKYLWETQHDGFFQKGNGGHRPTFAAKVKLRPEQFESILSYVENYPYNEYSLIRNQCTSFVIQAAALAGLNLESKVTIPIDPFICFQGKWFCLWHDPRYSELTIPSPDILERSLMDAVKWGRAEYALDWYRKTHPQLIHERISNLSRSIRRFISRYQLYRYVCHEIDTQRTL
jgi:hypothetical protein